MLIIKEPVGLLDLWVSREVDFSDMMKIVVDIDKEIIAVDAEMHADLEKLLLETGSGLKNLWGANIYPMNKDTDYIEFTSFINIRPGQNNRSMEVRDENIRLKIKNIIERLFR